MSEESKSSTLPSKEVEELVAYALHAAASDGLLHGSAGAAKHVPLTLTPAKFPRSAYELGFKLMRPYGLLVDRVSRDVEWLRATVAGTAAADSFSGRLLEVFDAVQKEGVAQPAALGLLRSDYMLDQYTNQLLQVELNTISASFGPLCQKVAKVHAHVLARFLDKKPGLAKFMATEADGDTTSWMQVNGHARLPTTTAVQGIASGLAAAHKLAGKPDGSSIVLFVVQPKETNFVDQRELEYELFNTHGVCAIRRTFADLATSATLSDDSSKRLIVDGQDVAVVYYRAGYSPDDYTDDSAWAVRLLMEHNA